MNHDENHPSESDSSDDFWGSTPDWSGSVRRPRRKRSERQTDVTGAIKGLWNAALTSGVEGTREHRALDHDAPRPTDARPGLDPTMFDDLDTEVPLSSSGRVRITPVSDEVRSGFDFMSAFDDEADDQGHDREYVGESTRPTAEAPVVAAPYAGLDADGLDPDLLDDQGDEGFAEMTPVPLVEREDRRRGAGTHIDPLLARIGAVVLATTLLVPIGIAMASDDADDTVASNTDDGVATDVVETTATSAAPATTEATRSTETADSVGSGSSSDATEALDPATLPPAVVVNPTPSDNSGSQATSESSTTESDGGDASASSTATDECAIDYEVQFGDFWLRLADAADVPLADLLAVNDATIDSPLYPDSTICLPAGAATPAPPEPPTTAAATTAAPTTAATTTAAPTTAAPTTAAPTTVAPTTAAPTTAAPTTTEPAPAPPPSPAGPEEIKQIIRDVWPDHLEGRALEVAYRESRYVPTAKNYCCYGLFQIYWSVHQSWLGDLGITDDQQLYDPATNARAAYALYQRSGGWGPWSL